jgi:hypothetical protein
MFSLLTKASQGFVLLLASFVYEHMAGAGDGVGAYGLSTLPVLLVAGTAGV